MTATEEMSARHRIIQLAEWLARWAADNSRHATEGSSLMGLDDFGSQSFRQRGHPIAYDVTTYKSSGLRAARKRLRSSPSFRPSETDPESLPKFSHGDREAPAAGTKQSHQISRDC
ncbi:hypothetical protein E4U19_001358 [Claviceps sp. Clav32 group G5]|nr:hypothetical protein E4U19_001358 [Claviceps sp. Clav32 group G5]